MLEIKTWLNAFFKSLLFWSEFMKNGMYENGVNGSIAVYTLKGI